MGLEVRPGEETSAEVKVYPLWDLATTVEGADAVLRPWLDKIGGDYKIFRPDENGEGCLNPDFGREGYHTNTDWILQPSDIGLINYVQILVFALLISIVML